MTPLAESANRPDWFRLAAQRVNSLLNRMTSTEANVTTAQADIATAQTDIATLQTGLTTEASDRATADTALDGRLDVLEAQTAYTATTVRFTPSATPGSPVEGLTYMDSTTHKLRTYDGTAWQDHW